MLRHQFSEHAVADLLSQNDTLCVVSFDGNCQQSNEIGLINTGLCTIDKALNTQNKQVHEVWKTTKTVTRGVDGQCQWNKTDDILCSAIYLDPDIDIETATKLAYNTLLTHVKKMGYPYPFRFWNYIQNINDGKGDEERYKLFCSGRLASFEQHGIHQTKFPAASALGSHSNGTVVYVFSAKHEGEHFRNNKQIDAFEYPRQYGRSSPSFSRATSIDIDQTSLYLVSGTASIIGHQTIASDDISEQLSVTVANLKHLLSKPIAGDQHLVPIASKVYIRHTKDADVIKSFLQKNMPQHNYLFTIADVCRDDLLVEIECHCEQTISP